MQPPSSLAGASTQPLADQQTAATPDSTTRWRIIPQLSEIDRLSSRWDELAADCAPMQHFIWSRIAAEVFGGESRLRVLAVDGGERVRAVAPFVIRGAMPPRWELVGARELSEPSDLLYEDGPALQALLDALVRSGMPLHIPRVFADSRLLADVRDACRGRATVVARPAPGCPRITLDDSWREPERKFHSARRSNFKRRRKIAQMLGPIDCEVHSPSRDQLGPLLEDAFRVEEAGWKGREGSALARDGELGLFFRKYAAAASDKGILRLFFLRIAGRAVAMQLIVECADRLWALKIGYDEEFQHCSPGSLLMLYILRYAAIRGLRSYEFLGTAAPWTSEWTKEIRPCLSLRMYPTRLRGMSALAADILQWGWKRAAGGSRLLAPGRRRAHRSSGA